MIVMIICNFHCRYICSKSKNNVRLEIMGIFERRYSAGEFDIVLNKNGIVPEEFKSTETIYRLYCLGRRPIRSIFLRKLKC